jgi:hypothetical protein
VVKAEPSHPTLPLHKKKKQLRLPSNASRLSCGIDDLSRVSDLRGYIVRLDGPLAGRSQINFITNTTIQYSYSTVPLRSLSLALSLGTRVTLLQQRQAPGSVTPLLERPSSRVAASLSTNRHRPPARANLLRRGTNHPCSRAGRSPRLQGPHLPPVRSREPAAASGLPSPLDPCRPSPRPRLGRGMRPEADERGLGGVQEIRPAPRVPNKVQPPTACRVDESTLEEGTWPLSSLRSDFSNFLNGSPGARGAEQAAYAPSRTRNNILSVDSARGRLTGGSAGSDPCSTLGLHVTSRASRPPSRGNDVMRCARQTCSLRLYAHPGRAGPLVVLHI